ncbi:MAG: diguanylate cyclase, partial [Lachnospiraceae bacterium]|nr:diguanylate cyclase [Lachnospiraceae bacterium]
YRTGGDEFVALLTCSEEQLKDVLQTLDGLLSSAKCSDSGELSVSKGVVVCKEHGDLTFDEMKELADRRMYEDKSEYYRCTGKKRRKS